jgi:hypothetical protein
MRVPVASDAAPVAVAGALDDALAQARNRVPNRLPTAHTTLPADLSVTKSSTRVIDAVAPLRLEGSLSYSGTGTGNAQKVIFDELLVGQKTFSIRITGSGKLDLDLRATPVLDIVRLSPPRGLRSWREWARSDPNLRERRDALNLLVETAAAGATASAYSPYLGSALGTLGYTTFHISFAPPKASVAEADSLQPRPVAITITIVLLLVLSVAGVFVWRRS